MRRGKLDAPEKPYLILAACLLCYAALFLFFSLGMSPAPEPMQNAPYSMGYYLISPERGEIRVIPLSGASLKSPSSMSTGAISSPYFKE